MKSMFDMGFGTPFSLVPKSGAKLGQDDSGWDSSGMYTSVDQGPPAESYPGMYTSVDQGPPAESYPGMYTSVDQGPPAEHVTGIVTQKDLDEWLKAPSSSTDWSKVAQGLLKGAGESYAAYQKAQNTFDSARAKVGLSPIPLQAAAAQGSSISPNVIFLVGGLAAVSLLVVLIRA